MGFLESSPSESFIKSSSLSELESKSFCLMIYELAIILIQKICSYPHRLYKASLFLKKKSFTNIFFFGKKKSKSFVTVNAFLIKEIPVFHNPGIIICYGKEK